MSCGKPLKHAQEKVKPITNNFNSFPFEKEGMLSFYKDPFNSIDWKNEGLQLGKAKPID
ncbi:hypothetical protein [Prochlorococcus sp. MIT 0801]|uniref:hypothetical protein n=1 Tax=Prochlorococcus sp. MIT 0801 TaxID=1501269 RepID=UPI0004F77FF0|nr:hypothetical protein [Prochlorococcus sp. MIT 0801]AIQ97347.1 hypothetical protein EW15_1255 [Prochlorococcus sp. MIT 0801]